LHICLPPGELFQVRDLGSIGCISGPPSTRGILFSAARVILFPLAKDDRLIRFEYTNINRALTTYPYFGFPVPMASAVAKRPVDKPAKMPGSVFPGWTITPLFRWASLNRPAGPQLLLSLLVHPHGD